MSSSELLKRPAWIDLQRETPPGKVDDFVETSDFETVARTSQILQAPDEAFRNGLIEGEQRGRAAAHKELEPVVAELRELGRALASLRADRLHALEGELIEIACELARRILHAELREPHDAVVRLARVCLEEAAGESGLVLRVSPVELDLVRTHAAELELDLADGGVSIQADASLQPGNVVLETATRCIDGRPDRILDHGEAIGAISLERVEPIRPESPEPPASARDTAAGTGEHA